MPKTRSAKRPWPITALGLLLLLQAAGLLALGVMNILAIKTESSLEGLAIKQPHLALGGVLVWLAALALLAAFNHLRARRGAWLSATLLQGLSLLTALILYFRDQAWYAYLMMLYGIAMVVYLNYVQAQTALPLPTHDEAEN